jgi:hypothetical protein
MMENCRSQTISYNNAAKPEKRKQAKISGNDQEDVGAIPTFSDDPSEELGKLEVDLAVMNTTG